MEEIFFFIITSLVLSAFFSAVEIAYVSANPLKLALSRNQNTRTARLLNYYYENPDFFLGTALVGNTLSLVIYGIYASKLIDLPIREYVAGLMIGYETTGFFELTIMIAQTTISTLLVLLVAEFTPKSVTLAMPNTAIEVMIHVMHVFVFLLHPFVWIVVMTNKFVLFKILKLSDSAGGNKKAGIADLSHYLMNQKDKSEENTQTEIIDADIFKKAIEFKTRKVRHCMVPRTDIVAVDIKESVEHLSRTFTVSGRSKIVIFNGSIDHVVGYCHVLKLFDNPQNIESVTVPILIVPETTGLQEMMYQFLTHHRSIAAVTDEFGGTAGIVTIEDIIEEILGEIVDEHDRDADSFVKISENIYEIAGTVKIADIKHDYSWNIPEGDYDTLSGYIMDVLGQVPVVNSTLETEDYSMTVTGMKGTRVLKVKIVLK
jgi:CBS domain containing-hemolysin-like protein